MQLRCDLSPTTTERSRCERSAGDLGSVVEGGERGDDAACDEVADDVVEGAWCRSNPGPVIWVPSSRVAAGTTPRATRSRTMSSRVRGACTGVSSDLVAPELPTTATNATATTTMIAVPIPSSRRIDLRREAVGLDGVRSTWMVSSVMTMRVSSLGVAAHVVRADGCPERRGGDLATAVRDFATAVHLFAAAFAGSRRVRTAHRLRERVVGTMVPRRSMSSLEVREGHTMAGDQAEHPRDLG